MAYIHDTRCPLLVFKTFATYAEAEEHCNRVLQDMTYIDSMHLYFDKITKRFRANTDREDCTTLEYLETIKCYA